MLPQNQKKKIINYILNNTNEAYINIYCIVPLFLWWLIIFSPVKLVCVLLLSVSLWIIRSLQLFNATLSVFVIRRLWLWCRRWGIPWNVAECCGNQESFQTVWALTLSGQSRERKRMLELDFKPFYFMTNFKHIRRAWACMSHHHNANGY